jgi:aldose 1-epimerase
VYTPPDRKSIAIENLSGAPDNFNNGISLLMLPPGKPKGFSTSYTIEVL